MARRTLLAFLWVTLLAVASGPAAQAQPGFAKAFAPTTIGPGSVSTLTFTITNTSTTPVSGLAFTDNLPAGMTIADPSQAFTSCGAASLSAPAGGGTISLGGGTLGGSSSCTVTVDVTSSTPGTHTNTSGDLTSSAGNSGSATADLTVDTGRPGFTKSFSPSTVFFGGRSTLTFTIDNSANGAGRSLLAFTDNLPAGMVVASPANRSTTCSGGTVTAAAGGSVVSLSGATLGGPTVGAGASCTVNVDVLGNATGALGNTSGELISSPSIGGISVSSGKAAATLTVQVQQLSLAKSFTDDPVAPGETVTLELTVRNLDRRDAATDIAFTDDLDAALSGLAAVGTPIADPCGSGSSLAGTSVLSLTGGNLASGASCTFSVTLQVPSGATPGTYTNTTTAVTADIGGNPVTGNVATDTLFVEPVPRLAKEFTDDPVGAGGSATLEFTITNTSPSSSATAITFDDVFDEVLRTASSIPADGFCGVGSEATFTPLIDSTNGATPARLAVTGANLGPGASCTFSIVLGVAADAAAGVYPNTTSAISATVDGVAYEGTPASDDLVVVAAPTLFKEFTDDPVDPGGTVTLEFTLLHDENAPGDATGIAFTDDLTATLSGLTATGLPANDVCGTGSTLSGTTNLSFAGGTLAPGESCTFSVTLDVPAAAQAGAHTNTTSSVTATVLGVTATGNAGTDDLSIAGLTLTKEFVDDPVLPGGTVTLRFTIDNVSPTEDATGILFTDDLDDTLPNLVATGLPQNDGCGSGSSLTGSAGNTILVFQNGSLLAGTSCTFDVSLQVPASAAPDTYANTTAGFRATFGGSTVFFPNASDELVVAADLISLAKQFLDDPVGPGETVTLRFTLTNLDAANPITDISFTDDLDAALSGLVATGLPIGACGGTASGTSLISFSGGSLAAGGTCSFDVTLAVPGGAPLGSHVNVTSDAQGSIGGLTVTGDPATDALEVLTVGFEKSFSGSTPPGGTIQLTFTIENLSPSASLADLELTDDLDAVVTGLVAVGLPATDVCGLGSSIGGTSFVTFEDGSLGPGASCTFSIDVQVPAGALPGVYSNETSQLRSTGGAIVAPPATAFLTVDEVTDSDGDGVTDDRDLCPGTAIPEGVPTEELKPNRYALVDGDGIFDTAPPKGNGGGPGETFTIEDTGGCSCEQIIAMMSLGSGHTKFGCSLGAMRDWVDIVDSSLAPTVLRP